MYGDWQHRHATENRLQVIKSVQYFATKICRLLPGLREKLPSVRWLVTSAEKVSRQKSPSVLQAWQMSSNCLEKNQKKTLFRTGGLDSRKHRVEKFAFFRQKCREFQQAAFMFYFTETFDRITVKWGQFVVVNKRNILQIDIFTWIFFLSLTTIAIFPVIQGWIGRCDRCGRDLRVPQLCSNASNFSHFFFELGFFTLK